jgi:hypothetical protein
VSNPVRDVPVLHGIESHRRRELEPLVHLQDFQGRLTRHLGALGDVGRPALHPVHVGLQVARIVLVRSAVADDVDKALPAQYQNRIADITVRFFLVEKRNAERQRNP